MINVELSPLVGLCATLPAYAKPRTCPVDTADASAAIVAEFHGCPVNIFDLLTGRIVRTVFPEVTPDDVAALRVDPTPYDD
jgi:hypothetical protein